jgi:phospholipase/carboxylesterase
MNRLPPIASSSFQSNSVQVAEATIPLLERTPLALSAPHRLFFPKHFESRYRYPLFIWLHSPDSSERELDEVMPALSTRNYIAIGLRGTEGSRIRQDCYRWGISDTSRRIAEELVMSTAQLAVEDLPIDPSRIFLGGFGAGGSMAQWVGLRNPNSFAGITSINGAVPDKPCLLTAWKHAKRLPVMYMYGETSTLCPIDQVAKTIHFTHRSALNYEYVQFNCGDCLDTAMTSMMNQFMMSKIV